MMADPTADDVASWIKAGSFDQDDGVKKILDAVKFKFQTGSVSLAWRIVWDGMTVNEPDMTLGEMEMVEKETRQSWLTLKPAQSAKVMGAVLRTVYQTRGGLSEGDARAKVAGLNALKVAEAVSEYQIEDPPKDSAA